MSRLTRDGTAEPVSRDQILRRERGQGKNSFPVQLTTCRVGNVTRLIHTLAICVTIHTYIMVTTRYSDHQGSSSRQNPCQVQPTEDIGNLSASRRCLWVRTTLSTVVWSVASISESESRDCLICCPFNKVIKSDSRGFLALGGLHEDKLCGTLQALAPITVKTIYQTSLLHIESNLDRLGLLSPTHGQRSQQQSGEIALQSVLTNKPKFLKATHDTEIRKIEIPRSMVVEASSW